MRREGIEESLCIKRLAEMIVKNNILAIFIAAFVTKIIIGFKINSIRPLPCSSLKCHLLEAPRTFRVQEMGTISYRSSKSYLRQKGFHSLLRGQEFSNTATNMKSSETHKDIANRDIGFMRDPDIRKQPRLSMFELLENEPSGEAALSRKSSPKRKPLKLTRSRHNVRSTVSNLTNKTLYGTVTGIEDFGIFFKVAGFPIDGMLPLCPLPITMVRALKKAIR